MNIEYILMMSFYSLRSIVAFKSENSINMALSRKIVRDVSALTGHKMCIVFLIIANDCDPCIQVFGRSPVDRM
jgi:hypothetical protein